MEHILVIDDDAAIREILADTFKAAGYRVHQAADGSAALGLLENHPVALMITDIVMPETEGMETIFIVKKRFPRIKIIAASGYGLYLDLAKRMGADWTVEKPFIADKLLILVRKILQPQQPELTLVPSDGYCQTPPNRRADGGTESWDGAELLLESS